MNEQVLDRLLQRVVDVRSTVGSYVSWWGSKTGDDQHQRRQFDQQHRRRAGRAAGGSQQPRLPPPAETHRLHAGSSHSRESASLSVLCPPQTSVSYQSSRVFNFFFFTSMKWLFVAISLRNWSVLLAWCSCIRYAVKPTFRKSARRSLLLWNTRKLWNGITFKFRKMSLNSWTI